MCGEPNVRPGGKTLRRLLRTSISTREIVIPMHLRTTASISLRTLLCAGAVALGLSACDGVDDQDALAIDEVEADDELAADPEPAFAPEFAAADDELDEAAEDPATFEELPVADDIDPSASCLFGYGQVVASVILKDQWNVTYGDVRLYTGNWGCQEAYSLTTVTNSNVWNWQHRMVSLLQYRTTGGVWVNAAPQSDSGWTSLPGWRSIQTPAVYLAKGTPVRACGFIEGTLNVGTTPFWCTAPATL